MRIMSEAVSTHPPTRASFATFCRLLYERHLVSGVGGNVSVMLGNMFLTTPSGICLRDMTQDTVVTVDSQGKSNQDTTPSKEFPMHHRIFKVRSDVHTVCHVHSAHIVVASTLLKPGPNSLPPITPGFVYLAYPLALIPFYVPGSSELADIVEHYFSDKNQKALLMQNHGLITTGGTMVEALNIVEEIDEAAHVYLLTSGRGTFIPEKSVRSIQDMKKRS
jgi:ribulose-5-phosphate 4-epimerase/fuculose-1-phosphate aldolase